MNPYPETVAKIVDDYLWRLERHLNVCSLDDLARDRAARRDLVLEVRSHIFEAYQAAPGEDDVARILGVLRKLGEPAEVVSERWPDSMVRAGSQRRRPLYLVAGILAALCGIPLGFGGLALLTGVLVGLVALVAAYYAAVAGLFAASAALMLVGVLRLHTTALMDRLVKLGMLQMDHDVALWLDQLTPDAQGYLLIAMACGLAAAGVAFAWLGRYLVRGLRVLLRMAVQGGRQAAVRLRRRFSGKPAAPAPEFSYATR